MAGPLEAAGALPEPSEYATLSMDRHLTGLWTQRSPLRDADVPYLYGKFYSASRFDSLIDGINREITARLTNARRPGSSVYNSNTFPAINSFYGYRYVQGGQEVIRVIADGQDGNVYDATAGQKTIYFTKSPGAGKARFITVNNYLYIADGIDFKKRIISPITRTAGTYYQIGQWIVDPSGNIQVITTPGTSGSLPVSVSAPIAIIEGDSPNTLKITCGTVVPGASASISSVQGILNLHGPNNMAFTCGSLVTQSSANVTQVQASIVGVNHYLYVWFDSMPFPYGATIWFSGLTNATWLNGQSAVIAQGGSGTGAGNRVQCLVGSYTTVMPTSYGPTADTGVGAVKTGSGPMPFTVGQSVLFEGMTNAWWLNGYSVIIGAIQGNTFYAHPPQSPSMPAFPYGPTLDTGTASLPSVTNPVMPFSVGQTITFSGITEVYWLNGMNAVISAISGSTFISTSGTWLSQMAGSGGSWTFPYGPAVDTGTGTSGMGWSAVPGGTTQDGTAVWVCKGSAVQQWQIAGPANAPTVTATGIGPGTATGSPTSAVNVTPTSNASSASPWTVPGAGGGIVSNWTSAWPSGFFHSYWLYLEACNNIPSTVPAGATISSIQVTVTFTINPPWPSAVHTSLPQLWIGFLKAGQPSGALFYESSTATGISGSRTFTQDGTGWLAGDVTDPHFGCYVAWANGADSLSPPFTDRTITVTAVSISVGYGGENTGSWQYGFTYYNSVTGDETTGSPLSPTVTLLQNGQITVSGPASPDPAWDTIKIYRTAQGQPTPLYLASVPSPPPGQTWTYIDNGIPDSSLVAQEAMPMNHEGDPPPLGFTAPEYHCGRVWGIVNNNVVYSEPLSTSGFAPLNTIPLQGELPVRLFAGVSSQGSTMFVWGTANIYAIFGDGTPSNPFTPMTKYMGSVGIRSYDCVTQVGSTYYALTSKWKFVSLDPGAGYVEAGFPIGDQFKLVTTGAGSGPTGALYDPSSSYVSWNEAESGDTGLYVSDGAVGWFRFSPVASPESGYLWSPRAVILGGTSAVQSIEVAPGVSRLLIAPQQSGSIRMRDSTRNSDWSDASAVSVLITFVGYNQAQGVIGIACAAMPFTVGQRVSFSGLTNSSNTWLNGQDAIVGEISGNTIFSFSGSWLTSPTLPSSGYDPIPDAGSVGLNYQAYPSWDVKGNIVLCQSGQVAEIAHIALKSMAVGVRPMVSLLLGEITPTQQTPFDPLQITSTDPPDLPPSETMYSDRYSALQGGICPKCDNFQLKVDYGSQYAPDELFLFEVYGAKHSERKQQ